MKADALTYADQQSISVKIKKINQIYPIHENWKSLCKTFGGEEEDSFLSALCSAFFHNCYWIPLYS